MMKTIQIIFLNCIQVFTVVSLSKYGLRFNSDALDISQGFVRFIPIKSK